MPTTVEDQNVAAIEYGQTLSYAAVPASGSPVGTYALLAGIREWGELPGMDGSKTETTNVDGASRVKQYAPVDSEPGTVACTLGWKVKDGATVKTAIAAVIVLHQVMKIYKITFSDGSTNEQAGFIDKYGTAKRGEKEIVVPIHIQFSGAPVFTPAA